MTRKFAMLLAGLAAGVLAVAMGGMAMADVSPEPRAAAPVRITDVAPDGGSTGVPRDTVVFADFDSSMKTYTLSSNIKLQKKGARRAVPMITTYVHANDNWWGYPQRLLQPDTVYQVVVDGGRDGVRGEDGGKLAGVDDPTARFKDGNVVWSFRTAE